MMASKIDFNILLAKADKNTNNACKILEEKKLQNQKIQQKNNTRNEVQSKQAALAFLNKKKEEIRLRTEKEAKELLEKKQKKTQSEQTHIQPKTTTTKTSSLTNDKNSNNVSNKKATDLNVNKNKDINKKRQDTASSSNSKVSHTSTARSSLINDKCNKKPVIRNNQTNTSSCSNINKQKLNNSEPPKPKLSYSQILKLADTFHQGKLKPNSNDAQISLGNALSVNNSSKNNEIKKSNNKNETTAIKSKNSNTLDSRTLANRPVSSQSNILKQKSNTNLLTTNTSAEVSKKAIADLKNKATNNNNNRSVLSKSSSVSSLTNESKNISSWDRIISDMKKKKPIKKYDQTNLETKTYNEYEDEDEYDSEMEDFIDDDDAEANAIEKKEYSKCIREIFNYNPKRYITEEDDDLDNMETDFHSQMKEEKRSLKMGILEDLEELKKEAELEKKRQEKLKKRQSESDLNNKNKKLKSTKT